MIFILKYWKYIAIILGVLSLAGAFYAYRATLIAKGYDKATEECKNQKQEAINENIKIKQKQDIINRPSDSIYIKRLRDGTA